PIAAIGMPALLYAKAQNKFCLMLRIVLWLSVIAFGIRVNSPPSMVISAASMATSVPVPMAIPISAIANAGASLMPSPTLQRTVLHVVSLLLYPLFLLVKPLQ